MAIKKKAVEPMSPLAAGIEPLAPAATIHAPKLTETELATFDFAVNVVKLNRAKMWVNQQAALAGTTVPTGKDLVAAVKERYIALGGLLVDQQLAGRAPRKTR